MAELVVPGIVTTCGGFLLQEGKFFSEVSNQVELLQIELKLMQGLLKDADARQNESELVRQWVAEIRDLAYDADDIIATHALTVGSRKGGGMQKVLERYTKGIWNERQVGSKIVDIMTKFSNLKTSFQGFGIRESMIKEGGSSSFNERQREQRQTFSYLEHDVVGFDDDLNKLVEFLLKEGGDNRVASICGMGGLGKTTLAKMVYNHREVKQHFDCRAWVYISQQCQRRRVWEEILISLLSKDQRRRVWEEILISLLSRDQRKEIQKLKDAEIVEKLHQVQCEKKCLVILDDIWNIETWNSLQEAFLVGGTGSKILLTSRNKQVCLHVDPRSFLCELQCLNGERSCELLDKIAISWREDSITKTKMKRLGEKMIPYCGGLPLAITVLGGLLAAKKTPEEWEKVLGHVKSYLHEQQDLQLTKVMQLSYDDLPCHLKPCFLYLAHFPEDFEIPTKGLIRMWMGEGFISQIQHRGGREETMEDVGDRYLMELVQRCMVQVGKRGSLGRMKTCRIHDLMRDFCVSKAQHEIFLQIINVQSMDRSEGHISKIRRLAINSESGDNSPKKINLNEYPYLRSVHNFVAHNNDLLFEEFYIKKFKLVRVLNLENLKFEGNLLKDIGCLIHLRYLSLNQSLIDKVPSSIVSLSCLETLDLRCCMNNNNIAPYVFQNMKQLKHLYLPDIYSVINGKLELADPCYLRTMVNVHPNTIQIPTGFKLNHLRVLKVMSNERAQDETLGSVEPKRLKGDPFWVPKVKTNKWVQDETLVNVKPNTIQIPTWINLTQWCPHIERLSLYYPIEKLPDADQFPSNLAKLTLAQTRLKEDPMSMLEQLPNLKILRLFPRAFEGKNMACSQRGFPLLQSLVIFNLEYLEKWGVKKGAMPSLCQLEINGCGRLKTIPDGLRFITTLQELGIKSMKKSFKDRLVKGGPDFDEVQHVPSLVFQNCDREW